MSDKLVRTNTEKLVDGLTPLKSPDERAVGMEKMCAMMVLQIQRIAGSERKFATFREIVHDNEVQAHFEGISIAALLQRARDARYIWYRPDGKLLEGLHEYERVYVGAQCPHEDYAQMNLGRVNSKKALFGDGIGGNTKQSGKSQKFTSPVKGAKAAHAEVIQQKPVLQAAQKVSAPMSVLGASAVILEEEDEKQTTGVVTKPVVVQGAVVVKKAVLVKAEDVMRVEPPVEVVSDPELEEIMTETPRATEIKPVDSELPAVKTVTAPTEVTKPILIEEEPDVQVDDNEEDGPSGAAAAGLAAVGVAGLVGVGISAAVLATGAAVDGLSSGANAAVVPESASAAEEVKYPEASIEEGQMNHDGVENSEAVGSGGPAAIASDEPSSAAAVTEGSAVTAIVLEEKSQSMWDDGFIIEFDEFGRMVIKADPARLFPEKSHGLSQKASEEPKRYSGNAESLQSSRRSSGTWISGSNAAGSSIRDDEGLIVPDVQQQNQKEPQQSSLQEIPNNHGADRKPKKQNIFLRACSRGFCGRKQVLIDE
eukprot:TRINITY_DN740_c0_g1_i1.p1 TRINITY_DN740_c0_g1~~TRINITY_DN740_c0_g1_i1.p1  ORF type:complete len:575 (+),score=157.75 TRINITY_DN740_c0_g1_i1:114-1727(+)